MDNTRKTLEGRIIVVTGASSGVGYAAARRLAMHEGAIVVAVARRRVFRIEALAKQIAEQSGAERMLPLTADMAAPGQALALAQQVQEKFGRIDGFLHGVNRALQLTALEVSDGEFDLTMQVNVKSALYGVQAIAPLLRRQGSGGVVIYNPTPAETPTFVASEAVYAAAAQALSALADGWRRQLAPHGVRVREVAPAADEGTVIESSPHDDLVMDALRETLAPAAGEPALEPLLRDALRHPIVLSQRGGLALTQFSER
ncbi:MAG: SDR family NAD(P)-dependent oxidoreductase [Armatimonadetes bacterium]|nr:SDR family NAD(P)-dependent oxidoreductase [Armatimonadota bacterium]